MITSFTRRTTTGGARIGGRAARHVNVVQTADCLYGGLGWWGRCRGVRGDLSGRLRLDDCRVSKIVRGTRPGNCQGLVIPGCLDEDVVAVVGSEAASINRVAASAAGGGGGCSKRQSA